MKKSKKKVYPDEYYSNGLFEVIRYENIVETRNTMSPEQYEKYIRLYANRQEKIRKEIQNIIIELQNIISNCDIYSLLRMAHSYEVFTNLNVDSESELSEDAIFATRTMEYIQSIAVCIQINEKEEMAEELYWKIYSMVKDLYNLTFEFLLSYFYNKRQDDKGWDIGTERFILDSYLSNICKGKRYAIYEIEHLKDFIYPQKELFEKEYCISVEEFLSGMEKLQHAFTYGFHEARQKIDDIFTNSILSERLLNGQANKKEETECQSAIEDLMGLGTRDIIKITEWSTDFVSRFSYSIGECNEFIDESKEYSGWLINKLPIDKKPFIRINDRYYCLGKYQLFDNMYRILQKDIIKRNEENNQKWSKIQGDTAEKVVGRLFAKIIPKAEIYKSNYYQSKNSKKQMAENDLLVIYDDNLIVIEVKSGNYTPESALIDINSHINSLKELIEKADNQSQRFIEYLENNQECKIYDSNRKNKKVKKVLKKQDYDNIIKICVTLENFNELEAKAEKIKYLKLNDNTIVISIDDLRVYADYFSSTCKFFHYLKQRRKATKLKKLELNDELDHLGLYIEYNLYYLTIQASKANNLQFQGYRQQLDKYYNQLYLGNKIAVKPEKKLPLHIEKIIQFIEDNELHRGIQLSNFLLDLDTDSKKQFNDMINKAIEQQKLQEKIVVFLMNGEVSILTYCHTDRTIEDSEVDYRKNTFANMKCASIKHIVELHLYYDEDIKLNELKFEFLEIDDIPSEMEKQVEEIAIIKKDMRIKKFIEQNKINKIGRNNLCPCGSGKKYKRCCGK